MKELSFGVLKFTHQNYVGTQTPYSGDDLLEKEITSISEVIMGMRINKPLFRVTVPITSSLEAISTLKAVQYGKSGKELSTYSEEVRIDIGTYKKNLTFKRVRNVKSIKIFCNNENIGGIGDRVTYKSGIAFLECAEDYQIYQRDENNKATIIFTGICEPNSEVANTQCTKNDQKNIAALSEANLANDGLIAVTDSFSSISVEFYKANTDEIVSVEETVFLAGKTFKIKKELLVGLYDVKIYSKNELVKQVKNFGVGDIWVAAGQSNMTDMGAITSDYDCAASDPIIEGMHIIYPENTIWSEMRHPAGEGRFFKTGMRTSPVTSFSRTLVQELGIPIGVVQSSVGGTNIFQWARGINPSDDNDGYLINAMEACFDNMPSKNIKGIIWYQGENDATREIYAYDYENLQTTLFRQFREFFECENLPIITTQINDANQDSTAFLGYYDAWSYLKDVQRQYPDKYPNTYVVGTNALNLGDTIHTGAKSNLTLGVSWAKIALNKVYGKTDIVDEHPTIQTAKVIGGNTIRLTFKNVSSEGLYIRTDSKLIGITNSLVTIPLGNLKEEFVVRQGGNINITASCTGTGTPLTITNAVLENEKEVVLTTAESLGAVVAVDCCYGKRFAPSLTDKATGASVLTFYNVIADL